MKNNNLIYVLMAVILGLGLISIAGVSGQSNISVGLKLSAITIECKPDSSLPKPDFHFPVETLLKESKPLKIDPMPVIECKSDSLPKPDFHFKSEKEKVS